MGANFGVAFSAITAGLSNPIFVAEMGAGPTTSDGRGVWAMGLGGSSLKRCRCELLTVDPVQGGISDVDTQAGASFALLWGTRRDRRGFRVAGQLRVLEDRRWGIRRFAL